MSQFDCIIVGAGISGLVAARVLQNQGMSVKIIDKSRGVGGRMATRRTTNATFDHGAQFFTVRGEAFQKLTQEMLQQGIVYEWCKGFPKASQDNQYQARNDGYPRYRGAKGMTSIAKELAKSLDVTLQQRVTRIFQQDNCWSVKGEGFEYQAKALLLTPPVPQSLEFFNQSNFQIPSEPLQQLQAIVYDPCFAVMAELAAPSKIPEPGAIELSGEPIYWIADNQQKGISSQYSVTIHAGPEFTQAHWDDNFDDVAKKLLRHAQHWLGEVTQKAIQYQVHRWRYSKPKTPHPKSYLEIDSFAPLLFAGDAFDGPKVEGAFCSGYSAAERLVEIMID